MRGSIQKAIAVLIKADPKRAANYIAIAHRLAFIAPRLAVLSKASAPRRRKRSRRNRRPRPSAAAATAKA
jgi:hypothetical protein